MPVSAEPGRADRFDTVVLDAGHGGSDEGAKGARGLLEKELVLDVAKRLAFKLREQGLRVVMTRSDDVHVPLEHRTAIANDARGDLFISIHANAAKNPDARGMETYFLSLRASDPSAQRVAERENRAFGGAAAAALERANDPVVTILGDLAAKEQLRESQEFARMAQTRLSGLEPGGARGVKQAHFVVLSGVQMPGSLVEIGFVTNRDDAAWLQGPKGRDSIASALAAAVKEYRHRHDLRRGVGRAPS